MKQFKQSKTYVSHAQCISSVFIRRVKISKSVFINSDILLWVNFQWRNLFHVNLRLLTPLVCLNWSVRPPVRSRNLSPILASSTSPGCWILKSLLHRCFCILQSKMTSFRESEDRPQSKQLWFPWTQPTVDGCPWNGRIQLILLRHFWVSFELGWSRTELSANVVLFDCTIA